MGRDVCRDAVLALPFGDQSQGRAVIQVTIEHNEDREDQPTTPLLGLLPAALSKQFFRCALAAKAICTGPLANLELPTVDQLAEAIATTISQRINTPPELQHAQWLTDIMTTAGVEMRHHHTEPTLMRVGDDNLCAIFLGKEDEEFADTLRLAVALTSCVALRAIRLRTIVIYLTESKFDPLGLLIHPFNQTIREPGELGGNTGHNRIRRAATCLPSSVAPAVVLWHRQNRTVAQDSVNSVREDRRRANSGTSREAPCRHIASPTTSMPEPTATSSDPSSPDHTPTTASAVTPMPGAQADDEEELELNYEENDIAMEVDTAQQLHHLTTATTELLAQSSPASQPAIAAELASLTAESHQLRNPQHRPSIQLERRPSQPIPTGKGKAATKAKHRKKQPMGRSRSDGATRNRSRSKPRLSDTRGSDNEWETDDDAAQPSGSSHQLSRSLEASAKAAAGGAFVKVTLDKPDPKLKPDPKNPKKPPTAPKQ
eukprot:jgi/Tetstr1/430654/TSEL_020447.t1